MDVYRLGPAANITRINSALALRNLGGFRLRLRVSTPGHH